MANGFVAHEGKTWRELTEAGILPHITSLADYQAQYEKNVLEAEAFLANWREVVAAPEDLKRVHALMFQNLTPWGGKFWAVEIGGEPGVDPELAGREFELLGLQLDRLAAHATTPTERLRLIAFYHARFEAIHAFRDGNGRMGRLLVDHAMALLVGEDRAWQLDRDDYMQALVKATGFDNLAPLSDALHRAYLRRNDPVGYVPTPFQMEPQRLPSETAQALLAKTERDRPELLAAKSPPLDRRWLGGFLLEDLLNPGVRYAATPNLSAAREVFQRSQVQEQSAGQAVMALKEIQRLQPYRPRGGTFTRVPDKNYIDLAKTVLAPALCNMTRNSGYELIGMCEELFDGTAEHAAPDFDEAYRNAKYAVRQVPIQALRQPGGQGQGHAEQSRQRQGTRRGP